MRYECVEGCPRKVSTGIDKDANFQINALYDTYTCSRFFYSKQVFANWLAKKNVDQFQANIDYQVKDLVATMVRDAQV